MGIRVRIWLFSTQKTGVLFAGDLVFYQRALTTPNSPGLSVWLADIATLQALPWTLIVPGHAGRWPRTQNPSSKCAITWAGSTS